MLPQIAQLICRRIPLLLLGAGAGSLFIANIIARRNFTPAQFTEWAYLLTLVTFFFSFSLLGTDQLLVRASISRPPRLLVPADAVRIIVAAFVLFLLAYALLLDGRILAYALGPASFLTLTSVGAIQVAYQIERTRGRPTTSQLVQHSWKFALVALTLSSRYWRDSLQPTTAVTAALGLGFLHAVILLGNSRNVVVISHERTDAARLTVPFLVCLGLASVLNMTDRVMVEQAHSEGAFAQYVYTVTILSAPFGILANYFGFHEAVKYRDRYTPRIARVDALRTTGLTVPLVLGWSLGCYVLSEPLGLSVDVSLWALLGLLSIVRCGYGVLSAAMGVRGSPRSMHVANGITILGLGVYAYAVTTIHPSVTVIVSGYLCVWALRFASYFVCLADASQLPPPVPHAASTAQPP